MELITITAPSVPNPVPDHIADLDIYIYTTFIEICHYLSHYYFQEYDQKENS